MQENRPFTDVRLTCSTPLHRLVAQHTSARRRDLIDGVSARESRSVSRRPAKKQKRQLKVAAAERPYPELEKIAAEPPGEKRGSDKLMKVVFREVDTFNLWLWFELYKPALDADRELLETVLESWFVIGRMGGFNSMNLQISQEATTETSFFRYNSAETETAAEALFMDYSEVERKDNWVRFWVNMGTADEVALDILINALAVFSKEEVGIKQLVIGGVNDDWPVPNKDDQIVAGIENLQNQQL